MKYIHLKWLTEWLESKKESKDGVHFKSFLWDTIFCELCKEEFKSSIYSKGRRISLLGYDVPKQGNFLVLEAINTEEIMKKKIKIIHIVDFKDLDGIILGRGNEAHVKISDISISRTHAYLRVINNEIWIEDSNSKFGSLVIQNKPSKFITIDILCSMLTFAIIVELTTKMKKLFLQVGRSFFTISCELPSNCWCIKNPLLTKGFSAYHYYEGFPEEIRTMMFPDESKSKHLESLEDGNHDFDNSENNTNYNLIESNIVKAIESKNRYVTVNFVINYNYLGHSVIQILKNHRPLCDG